MKSRASVVAVIALAAGCQSGSASQAPVPVAVAPAATVVVPAPASPPIPAAPKPATAPGAPTPAADAAAYAADIANLCNVMERSGAKDYPEGQNIVPMAEFLGANIKTQAAKDFMIRVQPLAGEAHAAALDAEATSVGLSGCALSAVWRR